MQTYNKIMQAFWFSMGCLLLVVVTVMGFKEGFSTWAFHYIFALLAFGVFFIRRWMMKRMVKHQQFLAEQEANKK